MLDGVGNTGILRHALVGKVDLALGVDRDVLKQSIAADGVIDIGFGLLVQVDDLGIAAALKVEDAVVVPAVLVIADEQTLRVGRKRGLARAGEAEEDGGVLAVHVGVGRAVHGSNALQGKVVVHHREHALLHLTAVPGVDDDLLAAGNIEGDNRLGIQTQLLVVQALGLGSGIDDKVGDEACKLFLSGADEHVGDEMGLPGNLHDEADGHARVFVGTAESIHNIELLVAQFVSGEIADNGPGLFGHGMVVVLVALGGPPDGVLRGVVHNDVLILGGTAGINAGHDVDGIKLRQDALVIAFKRGIHLVPEHLFITGIVNDFGGTGNAVFGEIQICHSCISFLPIKFANRI